MNVEKLIPKACKYLGLEKPIPLHNNGTPVRNWLHAQDTADAITTIIENMDEHIINNIFNIAGGFEQKNKQTVNKIVQCYFEDERDFQDYVDLGFKREGQDVRYSLDDSKLRSLGWEPKKNFDDEIQNIVKFYKNNFKW